MAFYEPGGDELAGLTPTIFEHVNPPRDLRLQRRPTSRTATQRRAIGAVMRAFLQRLGPDVCASQWGKWVAPGIAKFRLRMTGKQVVHAAWATEEQWNRTTRYGAASSLELVAQNRTLPATSPGCGAVGAA
jgi:hypothetical protein